MIRVAVEDKLIQLLFGRRLPQVRMVLFPFHLLARFASDIISPGLCST